MADAYELGFGSLRRECDGVALEVEGDVPGWLDGTLVRNGPGAFEFDDVAVDHWFDGLAMLHAFSFGGGDGDGGDGKGDGGGPGGVTYTNRFLRSDAYRRAREGTFSGGFATSETTLRERLWSLLFGEPYDNANVIVERIGDRYLALTESPRWVEVDLPGLETRGHVQYDGGEPSGDIACAHLQGDPRTGRVVNFETEFGRKNAYHVYEMDAPTEREHVASIPVEEPAYMHSFALTPEYAVLTEFPFVVDPTVFLRPGRQPPFIENFRWEPDRGTRFLVVDRAAGEVVATPRAEATFGFHHVNAYQEDGDVVVDLETVPDATSVGALYLEDLRAGNLDVPGGKLDRFRVGGLEGPGEATVERRELYAGATALPRISPAVRLREHRYVYAQGADQPVEDWPRELLKVDVETGDVTVFADGDAHCSEPVFVPRPDGDREDDGVVLAVLLDPAAERSELVVLDGETMAERARAPLPHAVPFDFHGQYFPEV